MLAAGRTHPAGRCDQRNGTDEIQPPPKGWSPCRLGVSEHRAGKHPHSGLRSGQFGRNPKWGWPSREEGITQLFLTGHQLLLTAAFLLLFIPCFEKSLLGTEGKSLERGEEVKWSHSDVSDSLWPHGLYSPWNSPGQNIGVGNLSLLQGIFPTKGLNPGRLHCRQILYQLSHQGSPKIPE